MEPNKLILYTDMDGTALTDWNLGPYVPDYNIKMIRRFISDGGLFSVASGRQYESIMKYFPPDVINAPVVCVNGAMIQAPTDRKVLFCQKVPDSYVLEAISYVMQKDSRDVSLLAADETAIWHVDLGYSTKDADGELRRSMPLDTLLQSNCLKLCFVVRDPHCMEEIQRDILNFSHSKLVTSSASGPHFLEVVSAGICKADGIRKATQYLGNNRTLVCIGDFYNDKEMLKHADIAACPENSPEGIRRLCSQICCSNNDGAVGDLIAKLYEMA